MATACALPTGHDGDHDWADPPRITCFTAESGRAGYRLEGGAMPPDWATRVAARGRTAWCEITVYDDTHVGVWGGEVWPSAYPALFATTGTPEYPRGTAQSPAGFQVTAAGQALLAAARAAKAVR
jgi:hypothetical protein